MQSARMVGTFTGPWRNNRMDGIERTETYFIRSAGVHMTLFIAHRTDGFGGRLYNMMITMLLAEIYDGEFRFTWRPSLREHHALDLAENTFERDFLAAHLISERDLRRIKRNSVMIDPDSLFEDQSIRTRLAGNLQTFVVSRLDPPRTLETRFVNCGQKAMKMAFERIRFNEEIQQVIISALEIPLSNRPVAIHLRSGDIIYGNYRLDSGFEEKVIPLPLASSIIDDCITRGQSPIIFGQDLQACEKLAEMKKCETVERLITTKVRTPTQRALFEMILLSRMECIHAGKSLFAFVPAAIGSAEISDPLNRLLPAEIVETILTNLPTFEQDQAFSRLQIAYCYRSALYFSNGRSIQGRLLLVDGAIKNDPSNSLYRFLKARILSETGHLERADAVLKEAFLAEDGPLKDRPAYQFLMRRESRDRLRSEDILLALSEGLRHRLPYFCLVFSIAAMRFYDYPKAISFLRHAISNEPNEPLFRQQGRYLAKSMASPSEWIRWMKARLSFHQAQHYIFNKIKIQQQS